jgi:hypothetical protein
VTPTLRAARAETKPSRSEIKLRWRFITAMRDRTNPRKTSRRFLILIEQLPAHTEAFSPSSLDRLKSWAGQARNEIGLSVQAAI